MFSKKKNGSVPSLRDSIVPRGFLSGAAKTGIQPNLPQMEWELGEPVPKVIEIKLSPANQEFLMLAHAADSPEGLNEFINSLLWQERFRQGYPLESPLQTRAKELHPEPKLHVLAQGWFHKNRHAEP